VGITRAMRQLYLTYAQKRAVFGAHTPGRRSRFLDEIPGDLLEETVQEVFRPGMSWSGPATMSRRRGAQEITWAQAASEPESIVVQRVRESRSPASQFQLGDDVVDPKFGDGVVIGLTSDGIVVRFARDGSERTLLREFLRVTLR
jgi:DNA helicase II / ATP-dependent DNA helicase PcrA